MNSMNAQKSSERRAFQPMNSVTYHQGLGLPLTSFVEPYPMVQQSPSQVFTRQNTLAMRRAA